MAPGSSCPARRVAVRRRVWARRVAWRTVGVGRHRRAAQTLNWARCDRRPRAPQTTHRPEPEAKPKRSVMLDEGADVEIVTPAQVRLASGRASAAGPCAPALLLFRDRSGRKEPVRWSICECDRLLGSCRAPLVRSRAARGGERTRHGRGGQHVRPRVGRGRVPQGRPTAGHGRGLGRGAERARKPCHGRR